MPTWTAIIFVLLLCAVVLAWNRHLCRIQKAIHLEKLAANVANAQAAYRSALEQIEAMERATCRSEAARNRQAILGEWRLDEEGRT